ncbi:MAG: S1 RNA-binding domain-containing protein [Minisyncoccales bacterium]
MQKINTLKTPKEGEIIGGKVVGKGRSAVYLDLGIFGTGIIYGKEYLIARDLLRNCKEGEEVLAKIISLENEDGYVELSANKAGQEFAWETIKEKKEKEELIRVKILGANKGGLLSKVMNIQAFLPVSQLSSQNYPKVEGGDTTKILRELQKFIGTEMDVMVLDYNQSEEKLIISEKIKEMERAKEVLKNYNVGDVVDGKITGIADFGAFITFGEGLEGLIHISELAWQIIKNPSEVVSEGEDVKAKIIEINNDRAFLSLKALKSNPWEKMKGKLKEGDTVKGKVTKINPFGAFIQLDEISEEDDKVQGLCHISEFGTMEKMSEVLQVGNEYNFEIISFEPKEHRMILKLK